MYSMGVCCLCKTVMKAHSSKLSPGKQGQVTPQESTNSAAFITDIFCFAVQIIVCLAWPFCGSQSRCVFMGCAG